MSDRKIPESWAISKLGTICIRVRGLTYGKSDVKEKPTNGYAPVLRANNIQGGCLDFADLVFVRQELIRGEQYLQPGDILLAMSSGSISVVGKAALVRQLSEPTTFGAFCGAIRFISGIDSDLMAYFFQTKTYRSIISSKARGANINNLKGEHLDSLDIPIMPPKEQKRIVAKIESTQSKIKTIQDSVTKAEELIERSREALLQKAFRGQLVPQDRNDEPASKLIERIRAEQAKDSSGKKKKKDEPPPIKPEEIPFEIPKSWEWSRLGSIVEMSRGKFSIRPRNDPSCFGGKYPFLQIGSLNKNGDEIFDAPQSLTEKGFNASKEFPKGTIMIAIVGATIGNLGVLGSPMSFPDSIVGILPNSQYNQQFILNYLRFRQSDIRSASYQLAGQPNIKIPTLENLLIPMPPLNEQQRIVAALERSNLALSILTKNIDSMNTVANGLTQSILQQAFCGKLVHHDISEGTGFELLNNIKINAPIPGEPKQTKYKASKKRRDRK
jgi:type I restriction enzyme S subunit